MVESVDCGDILYQEPFVIDDNETGYSIWHKTASKFISIFDEFFKNYLSGNIRNSAMPPGGSYYPRSLPFGGFIVESWDEVRIDAFIRAMHFPPFKGALLKRGDLSLEVDSIEKFRFYTNK